VGRVDERDVCIAGTGVAGLSLAVWCKLAGARTVSVLGRRSARLELARSLGADFGASVLEGDPAAKVREFASGGVDIFIEAVGSAELVRLGLSVLRPGGTLAIYGVPPREGYDLAWGMLPPEVRFTRPAPEEYRTYGWALDLLERGTVPGDRLMTHRWPLAEHARAFSEIAAGEVVKGMLEM
jgi:threonine dehydrogenase-like Zn-dependent dehydrogenase